MYNSDNPIVLVRSLSLTTNVMYGDVQCGVCRRITTWWSQTAIARTGSRIATCRRRRTSKRKQVNNRRPLVDETMLDKFGPLVRGGDCEIVAQQMHRCMSQQYIRCMGEHVVVEGGGRHQGSAQQSDRAPSWRSISARRCCANIGSPSMETELPDGGKHGARTCQMRHS